MTAPTAMVVGAGIAGLTAAYRLAQRGFVVRVLEAAEAPGGRMTERRSGSIVFRTGARLIYPFPGELSSLIDELGLRARVRPAPHVSLRCADGREEFDLSLSVGPHLLLTGALPVAERLRMLRLLPSLAHARLRVDPDQLATAVQFDSRSMAAELSAHVGPEFCYRWVEPLFRGARNWNAEDVSPAFLFATSAHTLGAGPPLTFAGGIGELTSELAKRVRVECRTRVLSVIEKRTTCSVHVESHTGHRETLHSDYVVCATEGTQPATLIAAPPAAARSFFAGVRYNSLGAIHYSLRQDVVALLKVFTRRSGRLLGLFEQVPAASASSGRPGLYVQAGPESTEAIRADPERRIEPVLQNDLLALFPSLEDQVTERVEQWIEHMLPVPYPGYARTVREFEKFMRDSPQRVHYCGDYLGQALVTGACATGARVAQRLADQIARQRGSNTSSSSR